MLIAEELFLLLRRDDGRPESMSAQRGYGLAAAVITDLVLAERITLSDDKDPRMSVLQHGPPGHPALDAAMLRLRERDGKKLSSLVTDRRLAVEEQVAAALAAAGVIGIEEKRALGLVPAKYPVLDPVPERRTREQLRVVLAGATPRPEDATLLAILQGLGIVSSVLKDEKGTLGRRDLRTRIEEVTSEVRAGDAVARAVASMNSAMMTVIVTDGGGDGGGGGGD
ncbi:Golgi phosphoprotein 3 (GPP34) [Nocardioides alpinus]|uniref:GPP34 family phosphoprotein n=1 Tax=Nocardioides alpinus TaxID=748909 RepID=A0A1I1AWU3_9ACTN|nr:GPP34 family phosphoprotein [Nocardioides alpinus]PKH40980.1 GPP34 family phosphoprotein [Nocardioides alpinus]SFB42569.1 Golgi phosphoprotein 3 (GPP34) [Nocardioides alpinus]